MNRWRSSLFVALVAACALTALGETESQAGKVIAEPKNDLGARVERVDEWKSPGLEAEVSGIYPHPEEGFYYMLANQKPPYREGQKPMLDPAHRGKLLKVDREGKVHSGYSLADEHFGGLAFAHGHLFVAITHTAEIFKVVPDTGEIVDRILLTSPAGGLEYDADRDVLLVQLYVGHPYLAVIDPESGALLETLWSDESTMGLAKVDGDLLSTWASGWDPGSYSELRVLDETSGQVRERTRFDLIHSVMAPAPTKDGEPGFLALVTTDSVKGTTAVYHYAYRHAGTP